MHEETYLAEVYGIARDIPLTYVEREHIDSKLIENLTRDRHVIIYGSSKQGKTCLRRHCLSDSDYIVVQCQNSWDISKLSEAILKQAGYEVQISSSRTSDGKAKLEVRAKAGFSLFGLGSEMETTGEGEKGASETKIHEPLQLDASDPNDLVRALQEIKFNKFIVLEDFHYLPQETQEGFAFSLKTIHETSKITFILIAVWREENRLIVLNGDLAGRVVSVDADTWSREYLTKVIQSGESLLNIKFSDEFKSLLLTYSLGSVYIVQECCYRTCRTYNINARQKEVFVFPAHIDTKKIVDQVISEQGARYNAFLTNFSAGFQDTTLEMYKWILFPVLMASIEDLETGLSYGRIRREIQAYHPSKSTLNPGNITQALISVPALQVRRNIKPFILDYDRNNLVLSVVDKGFLIWLEVQERSKLLEMVDLYV